MTSDPKADLQTYLRDGREAMLWKLDGLSEHDSRRPLVPTGTNLLGLLKHVAGTGVGYLGMVFDRPFPEELEPYGDNADTWARPDESRDDVVGLWHRAWAHADATIDALPLDALGTVWWWPEGQNRITLHHALVHVVAEVQRHAGHADLVRELVDGTAGMHPRFGNLPDRDAAWWRAHHDRVQAAADEAAGRT